MHVKQQFLDYAAKVRQVLNDIDLSTAHIDELTHQIENAQLIVPVVGGFSAGKSTLINSFLGKDILPTALTPETALAAELHYSDHEYIEAVTDSGEVKQYGLAELLHIKDNAQQFSYLRIYLSNQKLKDIQPLVLVDMPGFDSPNGHHNKAITEYLMRGHYFVFLTNIEDGTVTRSMKHHIESLQSIGKGFTFCLSKTDLRPQNAVLEVRDQIAEELEDYFDYDGEIVLLNNHSGESLYKILKAVDPNQLFYALFIDRIQQNYKDTCYSIDTTKRALQLNKEESDMAIAQIHTGLAELERARDRIMQEIQLQYAHTSVEKVVSAVENALVKEERFLVKKAISDVNAFKSELNEIVRTEVTRTAKSLFQEISHKIIDSYRISIADSFLMLSNFTLDIDFADQVVESINTAINSQVVNSPNLISGLGEIAKVVGLFVPFLGTILHKAVAVVSLVANFLFGRGKEVQEDPYKEISRTFQYEIIPQIKQRIREELSVVFQENIAQLIGEIGDQFEMKVEQKRMEIEDAAQFKQAESQAIETKIHQLDHSKDELSLIIAQLN